MKEACLSLFELGLSEIYSHVPWNLFSMCTYSVVMHFEKHRISTGRLVAWGLSVCTLEPEYLDLNPLSASLSPSV